MLKISDIKAFFSCHGLTASGLSYFT